MSANLLYSDLASAVTQYDIRQSRKRYYNHHALGIYLGRVEEIVAQVEAGADLRTAITAGFCDRLRDHVLRSVSIKPEG
jgi:hypothetical protein